MSPFNAAAWNGTKPLVQPLTSPLTFGGLAWAKQDPEANGDRLGGLVTHVAYDIDGTLDHVVVLRGRARGGRFQVYEQAIAAADIDREATTAPERAKLWRAWRQICRHLGADGRVGTQPSDQERRLIALAVDLRGLADELLVAERQAS